jgi:3-methyladenine DNA glycosylase AlkD
MWSLLLSVTLLTLPAPSPNTVVDLPLHKSEFKLKDLSNAEVLVAIIVPVLAGMGWLLRDYVSKTQEVQRQQFKEDLIASLSRSVNKTISQQHIFYEQKLQPIKQSLVSLAKELRANNETNLMTDKQLRDKYMEMEQTISMLQTEVHNMEERIDNLLHCVNAEVSAIFTACLKESVDVKLHLPEEDELSA